MQFVRKTLDSSDATFENGRFENGAAEPGQFWAYAFNGLSSV